MSFTFKCPFCEQNLLCLNENENTVIQCPNCGNDIVPERNTEPAPEFVHVVEMPKEEPKQEEPKPEEPKPEIKVPVPEKEEKSETEHQSEFLSSPINCNEIYTNENGGFKPPFAAVMFHYCGVASMTLSVFCFILWMASLSGEKNLYWASSVFYTTLTITYYSFGFSQIITCTAKNAYNTDKTVAILEKLEEHLSEKETRK